MINVSSTLNRKPVAYACADESCGSLPVAERELLQETGHVLLTIGHLVANISPLNQHVKPGTAKMLISLGNKLTSRK